MRICSFLPSATEILYALGLGDQVAGITYECDFPPAARAKPVVVHSRLPHSPSSAEIDRQVRDFLSRGESLYRVDMEKMAEIQPHLVITQDLCHVCAASPGDLGDALARLPCRPAVLSLTPHNLDEVFQDIRQVGRATGRAAEADRLLAELTAQLEQVEQAVAEAKPRPRVLCLEWLDPPFVAGHWVPEMVERAGGTAVLGCLRQPSFRVEWHTLRQSQPDIVVLMPCGYGLQQTVKEFKNSELPDGWADLPAVQAGRVFAVDANSYFSRPGPRLVAGLRLLAHLFHPSLLPSPGLPEAVEKL